MSASRGRQILPLRPFERAIAREAFARASELSGLHPEALLFHDRRAHVLTARAFAIAIMREKGMAFERIGLAIERDHTSALDAMKRLERVRGWWGSIEAYFASSRGWPLQNARKTAQ